MQTLEIELPCPECDGAGTVNPGPSPAYSAAVEAHRAARQAQADHMESNNPDPFDDYEQWSEVVKQGARLSAAVDRTQETMRKARQEDEARPAVPCPACQGAGTATHTVDLARAVGTLLQYVARHEHDINEGYPYALRDLLSKSKPRPTESDPEQESGELYETASQAPWNRDQTAEFFESHGH